MANRIALYGDPFQNQYNPAANQQQLQALQNSATVREVPMGRGGPPKGMKTRPVRVGYFRRFFAASSTEFRMGLRPTKGNEKPAEAKIWGTRGEQMAGFSRERSCHGLPGLHRPSGAWLAAALVLIGWCASRPEDILFERQTIDPGASETAAAADINGDGKPDIVSGEYWYEAPKWTRHRFRQIDFANNYIDDFSDLPLDVNGDGRIDIVSCSWFGKRLYWSENPGKTGVLWKDHAIETRFNVEFAFLVDLDNDGKARELLPEFGNQPAPLTWYEVRGGEFVPHAIADHSFGHGIGAGDVNRDGRNDIITPTGWFEAPADPRSGVWTFHGDFQLGEVGFIHVLDVNGDGRPDIVTSMAHNYGIFWMEQTAQGAWTKHMIDDSWSQAHSLVLADLNGDGKPDLVTGKRFMAHNGRDPGEREPLGVYWYEYFKGPTGAIEWVKHLIDYGSRAGGGMQVVVARLESKPYPEVVVGGKSGLFLFRRSASKP